MNLDPRLEAYTIASEAVFIYNSGKKTEGIQKLSEAIGNKSFSQKTSAIVTAIFDKMLGNVATIDLKEVTATVSESPKKTEESKKVAAAAKKHTLPADSDEALDNSVEEKKDKPVSKKKKIDAQDDTEESEDRPLTLDNINQRIESLKHLLKVLSGKEESKEPRVEVDLFDPKLSSTVLTKRYKKPDIQILSKNEEREDTPLHAAMRNRGTGIAAVFKITALIRRGALLNAKNAAGDTPLHIASGDLSVSMVKLLKKWGADPKIKNNEGQTPADAALSSNKTSNGRKRKIQDVLAKSDTVEKTIPQGKKSKSVEKKAT